MSEQLILLLFVIGSVTTYYLCELAFGAMFRYKHGKCPHKWKNYNEYKRTTIASNNQVMVIVDRCKYCGELKETEI